TASRIYPSRTMLDFGRRLSYARHVPPPVDAPKCVIQRRGRRVIPQKCGRTRPRTGQDYRVEGCRSRPITPVARGLPGSRGMRTRLAWQVVNLLPTAARAAIGLTHAAATTLGALVVVTSLVPVF